MVLVSGIFLSFQAPDSTLAQAPTPVTPVPTITSIVPATATSAAPTVVAMLPDLVVNVSASPDPVTSGNSLTYTMNVFNIGDAIAGPSVVTGTVPAGTALDSMGADCAARSGDTVACTTSFLPVSGSQSFTFTIRVVLSSGTLSTTVQADADNAIVERDETNNRASILTNVLPPGVPTPTFTATPLPAAPTPVPPVQVPTPAPVATEAPAPVQPAPAPPPPAPSPAQLWLQVVGPTQTYAMDDSPAWEASPGEWYYVLSQDEGWALAVWEGDPPENAVWIELNENVEFAAV